MQIFHVVSVIVPATLALLLPIILERSSVRPNSNKASRGLLYSACILFFISWYLPSPLIHGEDTSFVTHFVGGGIFTGLLWMYIKTVFAIKIAWYFEIFSLFALVSALGAINELFELLLVETNISSIILTDTNWDILANTLGALVVYGGYRLYDIRH